MSRRGSGCRCEDHSREGWRIVHYRSNYSAFNGYKYAPSAYSLVQCLTCGARWRTKAAYVEMLERMTHER